MPGARSRAQGPVPASPTSDDPAVFREGEDVEVTIEDVAQGGWCVARPAGRAVMFVRHALPGERVIARVTEVTSRFARADAIEIRTPSPDRVPPPCPNAHPGGCGGCDWQHASLTAQRALKAAVLAQQLRRLAGIDRTVTVEPLPGDEPAEQEDEPAEQERAEGAAGGRTPGLGWRTRVQFAVREDGLAGLRAHRSHEVIDIGDCLIAHPAIRALDIPGDEWTGAVAVEAAAGNAAFDSADATDNTAVIVVEEEQRSGGGGRGRDGNRGHRSGPRQGQRPRTRRTLVEGRQYLTQHAAGRYWQVSAEGFWQVHPAAADTLSAAVLAALEPKPGETVLDLYCGAGLFAGVIAPLVGRAGAVVGIEFDAAAVRDARQNLNDYPWVQVHRADVARAIRDDELPPARLVVADPPRAGLAREVVTYLTGDSPAVRFAYVSCDPATLARDLGLLINGGWTLTGLRAFDAFPMTHHVECVALLTRP